MAGEVKKPGQKRRALIVTSTWPAAPDDGTPSFVADLANGLAGAFDVTVVAPRSGERRHQWPEIDVIEFPYFFKGLEGLARGAIMPNLRKSPWRWIEVPCFLVAMIWHTVREARAMGPDGIISAQWILPGGVAALVASKLARVPFSVTVHGADIHTLRSAFPRRLKSRILRAASAIFPVSSSVRDQVTGLLPSNKHDSVAPALPMGIRPLEICASTRSTSEFLFVGRLAEKKGLETALRALAEVGEASLRVIGDGPIYADLRCLADELGIARRVHFLGRRPRAEVIRELGICAGLLIPSVVASDGDEEGTPVVLAEGLASGAPIIASKLGGLAEFIKDGDNGFLVQPGDVGALVERIRWAIASPEDFQQVGSKGAATFAGGPLDMNTTVEAYVRRLESIT